jgi:hypothetical protein
MVLDLRATHISQLFRYHHLTGVRGSAVVKALCYKPGGRGFDPECGEFLNLPNSSGRIRPWGLFTL